MINGHHYYLKCINLINGLCAWKGQIIQEIGSCVGKQSIKDIDQLINIRDMIDKIIETADTEAEEGHKEYMKENFPDIDTEDEYEIEDK